MLRPVTGGQTQTSGQHSPQLVVVGAIFLLYCHLTSGSRLLPMLRPPVTGLLAASNLSCGRLTWQVSASTIRPLTSVLLLLHFPLLLCAQDDEGKALVG